MIASLKFEPLRVYKVVSIDGGTKRVEIGFSLIGTTELTVGHIVNPTDMQDQVLRELRDLLNVELSERVIEPRTESIDGAGQDQEAGPAVGGPDRPNVESEGRGSGPVHGETIGVDTAALADRIIAPGIS